jgi:hypothetical protein
LNFETAPLSKFHEEIIFNFSVVAILISASVALAQDKIPLVTDLPKPLFVGTPPCHQRAKP